MHGGGAARSLVRPGQARSDAPAQDRGRPILCATCRAVITTRGQAVERGGAHEHSFANPAGIVFRIGCFAAAAGCRLRGSPTLVYTWFPGFAWRYALCSTCGVHLGWSYESSDSQCFFGLILDRLVEDAG